MSLANKLGATTIRRIKAAGISSQSAVAVKEQPNLVRLESHYIVV